MTKLICKVCGGPNAGRRKDARFCSNACYQRDRRRRQRENAPPSPPRKCARCGTDFVGRSNRKYCSPKCGAALAKPNIAATSADAGLIAYVLSDVIASVAIAGELEALRNKTGAKSALEARLRFELASPTWPHGALARCAVALFLLDHPNVSVGRWRHLHERRRDHRLKSALGLKAGF